MADIMENWKMENDPSFNFNTPEAKIAKEVAQQFVTKRSGKALKHMVIRKETEVILTRVLDLEPTQGETLKNLVKSMNITEENGLKTFLRISEQVFNADNNMSWGRIVTFFLFAALTLEQLKKNGKDNFNDKIALWLGICIAKQSNWMKENNGWKGFINSLGGPKEMRESLFNGIFSVTMGLGTLAAALYIQGK